MRLRPTPQFPVSRLFCHAIGYATLIGILRASLVTACADEGSMTRSTLSSVTIPDQLFSNFVNPPAEARPFVRWWWNGNCVTAEEITREIGVMHAAGIGGIEINPVELPSDQNKIGTNALEWLSPEWDHMVRVAADVAQGHGMITDLIIGSGWPFGGEFLQPGQMVERVYVNAYELEGPLKFNRALAELMAPPTTGKESRRRAGAPPPRFLSARLSPGNISDIAQTFDLTSRAGSDGMLAFDVPAGHQTLYVTAVQEGYASVGHGTLGASGPVLDHFNKAAVQFYLDRMSGKLGPALGGQLGAHLRAMFCDSLELEGANWTADFAIRFRAAHGYDVIPYLPFIVNFSAPAATTGPFSDTVLRARYDFCQTIVQLFQENFIHTYNDWCHANGALSRFQAYGAPWLLGMLDGYLIPDIPEANNWLFVEPEKRGMLVWTKYASSGGHLEGRRLVSTEAMTNLGGVFQATLDQIKAADDLNFIMGINHSILQSFNYSPREAGFPGWVRFGTYVSEQNTWWPYFKHWSAYNARISAVMQATRPVVPIAILGPEADVWSKAGLERGPFQGDPWYVHQLWKTISNCGSSADYLSESVVQRATFTGGKFRYGPMAYEVVIVAGAKSLQPATAAALLKFADAGGRIVFAGEVPQRAPSLQDAAAGDNAVRVAISTALEKYPAKVIRRAVPPDREGLLAWTDALLDELGITRAVRFIRPDARVYQTLQRDGDRDVFFLVNTDAINAVPMSASFNAVGKSAWRWDSETGERMPCATPADGKFAIPLQPHESLLLVFERAAANATRSERFGADAKRGSPAEGTWRCDFQPAYGMPFTREAFELVDLGKSPMPELAGFAGTITYRKDFQIDDPALAAFLDLGIVSGISEATLNGTLLGTRWYGRHIYDLRASIHRGRNQLTVKVTTVLFNYTRTLSNNEAAMTWLKQAAHKEPVSAGLIGPVMLYGVVGRDL